MKERPSEKLRVTSEPGGVVHVDVEARVVNAAIAAAMCGEIKREAQSSDGRPLLLFNLGALSKATPRAGFYAMRQIKQIDPRAIGFYGGRVPMRVFARAVLGLARFRTFRLFPDAAAARAWLAAVP